MRSTPRYWVRSMDRQYVGSFTSRQAAKRHAQATADSLTERVEVARENPDGIRIACDTVSPRN